MSWHREWERGRLNLCGFSRVDLLSIWSASQSASTSSFSSAGLPNYSMSLKSGTSAWGRCWKAPQSCYLISKLDFCTVSDLLHHPTWTCFIEPCELGHQRNRSETSVSRFPVQPGSKVWSRGSRRSTPVCGVSWSVPASISLIKCPNNVFGAKVSPCASCTAWQNARDQGCLQCLPTLLRHGLQNVEPFLFPMNSIPTSRRLHAVRNANTRKYFLLGKRESTTPMLKKSWVTWRS